MFSFVKTQVTQKPVQVPTHKLPKNLGELVSDFRDGQSDAYETLVFLVESTPEYNNYYTITFHIEKGDELDDSDFYDVFIGSYIIDHTDQENLFIEIEDDHIDEFSFAYELFEQLNNKPCFLLRDVLDKGYTHFVSQGFRASDRTSFQKGVELLKS